MKIDDIDVDSAINSVKELLAKEKDLSPALKSALEVLLLLVTLLLNRITLNSKNSSKPPSTDPNRKKTSKKGKSGRKPGGQKGRNGTTLEPVEDPDEVTEIKVDRRSLPKGPRYQEVGHEIRQVIDIDISRFVIEYRAQILEDEQGNRFVAAFPEGVRRPVQYGLNLKANAVYMSQYQLIPYDRIRDHFQDQMQIPVSAGSVFNFNQEAHERLEPFEQWAKTELAKSILMHADETGINIGVITFTTERGPRVIGNPVVEGICFTKGDEEIVELAAGLDDVVVISSDREVREQAEADGAVVLWSEALAQWLARS